VGRGVLAYDVGRDDFAERSPIWFQSSTSKGRVFSVSSSGGARHVSKYDQTPLVEVEVVHVHGPAPLASDFNQTLELWTQRHVYILNPSLKCLDVVKTSSREQVKDRSFIGARLVGGQQTTDESIEISRPFPRPGSCAVFEVPKGDTRLFRHTSTVERVLLRVHITTVTRTRVMPTWEDIAGHPEPTVVVDFDGDEETSER